MKNLCTITAGACLAALSLPAAAQPASNDALMRALSRCDATVFEALAKSVSTLGSAMDLTIKGNLAYIKVPDRSQTGQNRVGFRAPVRLGKLEAVGAYDEMVGKLGEGATYSWGVLVKGSVADVAKGLRPLVWDAPRLRADGDVFVRSEVFTLDNAAKGWAKVQNEPTPEPGTVERMFMIEPDTDPALARVGCTLRGSITEGTLRELRPDLGQ